MHLAQRLSALTVFLGALAVFFGALAMNAGCEQKPSSAVPALGSSTDAGAAPTTEQAPAAVDVVAPTRPNAASTASSEADAGTKKAVASRPAVAEPAAEGDDDDSSGAPEASDASHTALGAYIDEIATLRRGLQVPDGAGIAQPAIIALGGSPHSGDIAALKKLKTEYEAATKTLLAQHAPDAVQVHRLLLIEALTLSTTHLGRRIVAATTGDGFDKQRARAEAQLNALHSKLQKAELKLNASVDVAPDND